MKRVLVRENTGEDSLWVDWDNTAVEDARGPPVLGERRPSATVDTAPNSQEDEDHSEQLISLDEPFDSSHLRRDSDADFAEKDKGLKRKLADRATSQGPQDFNQIQASVNLEPLKRHRDDTDKDDNPRETKRPSPPPELNLEPKKSPAPRLVRHRALCSLGFSTNWIVS